MLTAAAIRLGGVGALVLSMSPAAAVAQDAPAIAIGVETRRERLRFHFDNPSTFDTPEPVPHFFEQRYTADNLWLVVHARYVASIPWDTRVGFTPPRDTTADDYDTFFDPDGTVWVSGTTGPARARSLSIAQMATIAGSGRTTGGSGRIGGSGRTRPAQVTRALVVGYRLRVDTFDFGVGHKTVTRNGSLVAATDVTTRESTMSQLHELIVSLTGARPMGGRWHISARGDAIPIAVGRLRVRLPDKYPGQDLVFVAKAFAASGDVALVRRFGSWQIEVGVEAGRSWNYRASDRVELTSLGARCSIGR